MIKYIEAFISGLALGIVIMSALCFLCERDTLWLFVPMIVGTVMAEKINCGWLFLLAVALGFKSNFFVMAVLFGGAINVLCGKIVCEKSLFGKKTVFALLGFFAASILYMCL